MNKSGAEWGARAYYSQLVHIRDGKSRDWGPKMETATLVFLATVAAAIVVMRWVYVWGHLIGIRETLFEVTRGVSTHYERKGEEIPETVAKAVDDMKAYVAKAKTAAAKCEAYRAHLWRLGDVMGGAAWGQGFEAGQRWTAPSDGEIRVDLTLKELRNLCWLAHFGFENMMWQTDGSFTFSDQKDANEATRAIEALERCTPDADRDPSDPYALAFNRQTMIWERWPAEKPAPGG
jgi:hypothetical protein